MVFSYNKAINLDQNRLFLNTKIRRHCASTKCLNGNHYHPWSVSWTTMPACLQTCNWKRCVALGWRGLAATTAFGRYSSPGVAAHCQILHLHLCPWTCGSEVLQAMLVGKLHPFTTTLQSVTMLRRFFPWLFLLWGSWTPGEAKKRVTIKLVTGIT